MAEASHEIALMWMSLDFTDDQSTLVQVMAWCRQATSHYLSQCWPRSLSPYDVTSCHMTQPLHTTEKPKNTLNSLAAGRFKWNFKYMIFKTISVIDGRGFSSEIVRQQANIWKNVDPKLRHHMVSLGDNEFNTLIHQTRCSLYQNGHNLVLTHCGLKMSYGSIDLCQHWLM